MCFWSSSTKHQSVADEFIITSLQPVSPRPHSAPDDYMYLNCVSGCKTEMQAPVNEGERPHVGVKSEHDWGAQTRKHKQKHVWQQRRTHRLCVWTRVCQMFCRIRLQVYEVQLLNGTPSSANTCTWTHTACKQEHLLLFVCFRTIHCSLYVCVFTNPPSPTSAPVYLGFRLYIKPEYIRYVFLSQEDLTPVPDVSTGAQCIRVDSRVSADHSQSCTTYSQNNQLTYGFLFPPGTPAGRPVEETSQHLTWLPMCKLSEW